MKILLLSAYDAVSHRYWREGLVNAFPEHQWTVLTLPDRYFSWRLRGNSLSWAMGPEREILEQPWDRIIATSMVDLSSLRGMVPSLGLVPTTVYFHENQFVYPRSDKQKFSPVEPQLQSIYTALCAEQILFNSEYNRTTFMSGAAKLLKKLPDHVPSGVIEQLQATSKVVPVPLANDIALRIQQSSPSHKATTDHNPLLICWAARWEYDKGPDRLLEIVEQLEQRSINYELCILGQAFRKRPPEFETLENQYSHRLRKFGFAQSREEYLSWLSRSDILLSTSRHEFQGIAVLEGVALGAIPVLPNEQSYPYLFSDEYLYKDPEQACTIIEKLSAKKLAGAHEAPDVSEYLWQHQRASYEAAL